MSRVRPPSFAPKFQVPRERTGFAVCMCMPEGPQHAPTKVLTREIRFARYRLVVVEGPDPGRTIEGSEDEISVGSALGNTLVLTDPTVSRHHIAIAPTARGHLVRDL